jgi:hypothetical protein
MGNAIWNIFALAIGALLTWFFTRLYYTRAAQKLVEETKQLRNLLRIVLEALEEAKMIKLTRDASGTIIGRVHDVSVQFTVHPSTGMDTISDKTKEQNNSKRSTKK